MSWQEILGHDNVLAQFQQCVARGRLASSFLFIGPAGVGKHTFALKLAEALLCPQADLPRLEPCGDCLSCRQVRARSHPDLDLITRPADKSVIPLDLLIGDKEHRMREGLCHRLAIKSCYGGRKVAIIDDADYLNQEGANALLKTLEEPPANSLIILVGTSRQRQLPTIRSRCQIVRFQSLEARTVAKLLIDLGLVSDREQAGRVAEIADGSLRRAMDLTDPELWTFRDEVQSVLQRRVPDPTAFTSELIEFVEVAGKEAGPRRRRLQQVVLFATEFYRQQLRESIAGLSCDEHREWSTADATTETITELIECGLETMTHIDRNANLATLQHWWVDELARINARLAS